jgi:hypothetical protein
MIKSVLSAIPTYFLTVFKMTKWGFHRIDRFRRSFLWKGHDTDNVRGGHYLVNWQTCQRPRKWGGFGIKNLEVFNRALRLRWLWHQWDEKDKPWKHLIKVTDRKDRQLFFQSTVIHIGNGKNTPFWEAKWLQGVAPKELAPSLYKVARFKHGTIYIELKNSNWIRNLKEIIIVDQLEEFTMLFMIITSQTLTDHHDSIS